MAVRDTFADLMGCWPSEAQWNQAGRGMNRAGLGLRHTAKHAAAAYVASRAATVRLCSEVDASVGPTTDSHLEASLRSLKSVLAREEQVPDLSHVSGQRTLSRAIDAHEH